MSEIAGTLERLRAVEITEITVNRGTLQTSEIYLEMCLLNREQLK